MHRKFYRLVRGEPVLLFAFGLMAALWLMYGGTTPYLDGSIDFAKTMDFHNGGLTQLFAHWNSDHPPLKVLLGSVSFSTFGIHARSYGLPALPFFIVGLPAFYLLLLKLTNTATARVGTLLLATDPLFLSLTLFAMTDFMVTTLAILAFAAYAYRRWTIWGVAMIAAVMAKETAALLPAAFVFQWVLGWWVNRRAGKPAPAWITLLWPLAAVAALGIWTLSLKLMGRPEWSDWIFAPTGNQYGAFGTILANIRTGELWNDYAVQNWLHLFVMNFQWVITLLALFAIAAAAIRHYQHPEDEPLVTPALFATPWPAMVLFGSGYVLLVLTFQTYTIPRYVIPAAALLIIPAAICIARILARAGALRPLLIALGAGLLIVRLFMSVDPVSIRLWGRHVVMGQTFYGVAQHLSGNDGLTYNLQFHRIAASRSHLLDTAKRTSSPVRAAECNWIFPDPRNDRQVAWALGYLPEGAEPVCLPA